MRHFAEYAGALGDVVRGKSTVAPDPKDKRFADPAWQSSFLHRRLMQVYTESGQGIDKFITATDLSALDKDRARFVVSLIADGIAPTNTLPRQPDRAEAVRRHRRPSAVKGLRHFLHDPLQNQALPSQIDTTPFEVGKNLAVSPGAVVFRNEVLELIQYAPTTAEVHARPLLMMPAADQQVLRLRPRRRSKSMRPVVLDSRGPRCSR